MGHSTHAVAFRLAHRRNWANRSPFIGPVCSLASPLRVERVLQRRLRPPLAPILSAASISRRSPFGAERVFAPAQFTPLQRLLGLLYRRSRRRRSIHPLALVESPPAPPTVLVSLAPLWLPFLRFRFGRSWSPLLGLPSTSLQLFGLRSVPPPSLLCRFLLDRVRSGLPLGRLVNSFLGANFQRLAKQGVLGILLRASGRFTRSQLATTLLFRRGRVPLATVSLAVNQTSATASLKYGACTLTLWLSHSPSRS